MSFLTLRLLIRCVNGSVPLDGKVGQTATPRVAQRHPERGYYEQAARQVPLARVGQPGDIAAALLFFLSDLSQWATGQTLVVDGGAGRKYQYNV